MAWWLRLIWGFGVALLLAQEWMPGLVLTGLGTAYYLVTLRTEPWRHCRRCGGHDEARSRTGRGYRGTYNRGCRSRWCYKGDRLRWGVRLLTPGRAKTLTER